MKKIILLLLAGIIFGLNTAEAQVGGVDYYRVKSALLASRRTFDFRLSSAYLTTDHPFRVPLDGLDTLHYQGQGKLGNLRWSLRYGWNNNWEVNVSGVSFMDRIDGTYRYGAGDTRVGVRLAVPNVEEAEFNWSVEAYYSFPSGFGEGNRLIREFSSEKSSFGAAMYADFNWRNWTAKVNGGYYHAGGRIQEISDKRQTFWYNVVNGIYGITPNGSLIQSSQFHIGFGLARNFLFGTTIFGEYFSQNVFAKTGDGKSLGNIAAGMTFYQRPGIDIKLGADIPLGEIRSDMGIFLDLRMNNIIGRRRRAPLPPPLSPEDEPALEPGRKPFIYREGVYYSLPRRPIRDTVFIIDGSPSMLGRGIGEGRRGEEVLKGIIEFIQTLIDSIPDRSNIALISYSDEVATLSWQNIDASKKDEIKNSVRDVPDDMNVTADKLETDGGTLLWREQQEAAMAEAYKQLESFSKSNYNRQHLQRVILFSDGIGESTIPQNLAAGFDVLQRRYQINREDFRFFYYIHTNPQIEGARVDENIITFAEREDGKVKRAVDINNVGEELIEELAYNRVEGSRSLQYLSQISKIAVLDFNTRNFGGFSEPLVNAFRSVFDYKDYFVLTPQDEVRAITASEGIRKNQKVVLKDMVKIGKRLGVDYVVYGEVVKYKIERGRGIIIPYIFGLPKTEIEIEVAIKLVNVSDGTLAFVDNIEASSSRSEGIMFIPKKRENRMNQLSGVDLAELQKELMVDWAKKLQESMFQDMTIRVI